MGSSDTKHRDICLLACLEEDNVMVLGVYIQVPSHPMFHFPVSQDPYNSLVCSRESLGYSVLPGRLDWVLFLSFLLIWVSGSL